jgi:hypothetical protein
MATNPWSLPKGLTSAERKAVKAVFDALKAQQRSLSPEALNALQFGNIEQFLNLVQWETLADFGELKSILADMASKAGIEVFKPMGGIEGQYAFDLVDAKAVAWAEREAAKLVTEITRELRNTIRQTVADATAGNLTVDQLARRIRTNLPLTTRDARAVDNFRERNFRNYLEEGMEELKARTKAEEKAQRYADKMIRRRSKTIARTETAFAAMEGRYFGWETAVGEGLIDPLSKKEWIAEPDACEICLPLDGMIIAWNAEFPAGVKMAPAHPNCRCAVVIMPPDTAETPYTQQADADFTPPPEEDGEFLEVGDDADAQYEFTNSLRDRYGSSVTNSEIDAIVSYTGGSGDYHKVNGYLRDIPGYQQPDSRTLGFIDNMDSVISKSPPLEKPIITYRGMSLPIDEFKYAETFTDLGYVSTSHNLDISLRFTREYGFEPIMLQVQIPKGARVLDPTAARLSKNPDAPATALAEQEVILPRNTKFRILNTTSYTDDGGREIPLYVVEPIL